MQEKQGKKEMFESLVLEYSSRLYSLCFRMLMNKHDSEDALQLSFLKAFKSFDSYDSSKASLYTWLYRITYNCCLDKISKKKEFYGCDKIVSEHRDNSHSQEDELIQSEQSKKLKKQVDDLPEKQKSAIVLFHFEELKMKEASQVMGVSVKAFESLLIRARKALKNNLLKG